MTEFSVAVGDCQVYDSKLPAGEEIFLISTDLVTKDPAHSGRCNALTCGVEMGLRSSDSFSGCPREARLRFTVLFFPC